MSNANCAFTLVGAAGACPAASIGRQMAEVDRLSDLADGGHDRRRFDQLEALREHLLGDLEWITPASLEGLMVTAMALRDANLDLAERVRAAEDSDSVTADELRFNRTFERLIEGLSILAGRTPADVGVGFYWDKTCKVAPRRADATPIAA